MAQITLDGTNRLLYFSPSSETIVLSFQTESSLSPLGYIFENRLGKFVLQGNAIPAAEHNMSGFKNLYLLV